MPYIKIIKRNYLYIIIWSSTLYNDKVSMLFYNINVSLFIKIYAHIYMEYLLSS